ncbi:MAG: hypothetical protein WC843_03545 [Candidatus Gracilibacteria bacterium]|jgi:hypothetical protein
MRPDVELSPYELDDIDRALDSDSAERNRFVLNPEDVTVGKKVYVERGGFDRNELVTIIGFDSSDAKFVCERSNSLLVKFRLEHLRDLGKYGAARAELIREGVHRKFKDATIIFGKSAGSAQWN